MENLGIIVLHIIPVPVFVDDRDNGKTVVNCESTGYVIIPGLW